MNQSNEQLKSLELLVSDAGELNLLTALPEGAHLQFADLHSVKIMHPQHGTFELVMESPVRFSPGSHLGFEFDSSHYKNGEQAITDNFKTGVSVNLLQNPLKLITAFTMKSPDGTAISEWKPAGVLVQFYYDMPMQQQANFGATLPEFMPRRTVRAARIDALRPDETHPGFNLAITEPSIGEVLLPTFGNQAQPQLPNVAGQTVQPTKLNSNSQILPGDYLVFQPDGQLDHMPAAEFVANYRPVTHSSLRPQSGL